jgi:hypothetical protein
MVALIALSVLGSAQAGSGRLAGGITGASGVAPVEPAWTPDQARPAGVGCVGASALWITGGYDYAAPDGKVLRAPDPVRWGGSGLLCPTSSGGLSGGAGVTYGRQWGGALYVTTHATAGLSGYSKEGDGRQAYFAVAPYLEPVLAIGLAVPPGMSVEAGPYAVIAPPVFQAWRDGIATGSFVGHIGLRVSLWAGAASPTIPWR